MRHVPASVIGALVAIMLAPGEAIAHGGGLDFYGCHHDNRDFRKNYHCHQGKFAQQTFRSKTAMLEARSELEPYPWEEAASPRDSRDTAASPRVYHGTVVGVTDGDTLTLLTENTRQRRIRLSDIDTPERRQAFGSRATQALAELTFRKEVRVVYVDTDRYGRMVGRIYVGDTDVSAELVQNGYAWVYRKYSDDAELLKLEAEAREKGLGLWTDSNPIPPWEWRRGRRTP